jgi:hypothetical protein
MTISDSTSVCEDGNSVSGGPNMANPDPTKDPEFKRVLGNLLKAPPKPHADMKIGRPKSKPKAVRKKR